MRKKFLEKKLKRLQEKREALKNQVDASTEVTEVRSLSSQLDDIDEEIAEIQEEIDIIDDEARSNAPAPANAKLVNGRTVGSFQGAEVRENPLSTMEYRQAFMNYAIKGTPIPAELRGEAINTADTGVAIPMTIMNEVINTVRKRYGNLYSKVKKTSVQGGVEYSIGALQGTFKWINESTTSPRQDVGSLGSVVFKYNIGEIRIAQTFLSNILTLSDFEVKVREVIAVAYLQAMDTAIVKGTGKGQPTGILNDVRVTNVIEMTEADLNDWTAWRKKFFAKLPLGYRAGEFIFPLSTVETYLETMADANNNPVFRQATGLEVNDGDAMNPNGRFFGRDISLVEPDILPDFDTASAGDVIGIFWQPMDYAINTNMQMGMKRYFDEDNNKWINKLLTIVDGKVLNPKGYYLIKKKNS